MISVVGIGPGLINHLSLKAYEAITTCDVVVGYKTYVGLIKELIKQQEVFTTGMRGEVARCQKALELAKQNKSVCLVSGGDSGVYGMAGLMHEIIIDSGIDMNIEIIPGITAANAAAASLGAAFMHDYVTISLSDLLTSWSVIEKRLHCAGMGDFVVAIYNPKSKGRVKHINKAQDILLQYKDACTPVGIVRNAKRENEQIEITNLANMCDCEINMSTMLIVGNSKSYVHNSKLITPRGYSL